MGRFRFDVRTIRCIGTIDMVGIFVGYYGTSYLFRYLWNCYGCIRLLLFNETGNRNFFRFSIWFLPLWFFDKIANIHRYRIATKPKWMYKMENCFSKFQQCIYLYDSNMRFSHCICYYEWISNLSIIFTHTHTHSHMLFFNKIYLIYL